MYFNTMFAQEAILIIKMFKILKYSIYSLDNVNIFTNATTDVDDVIYSQCTHAVYTN